MTEDRNGPVITARQGRFLELAWANNCEKERAKFVAKWGPLPLGAAFHSRNDTEIFWTDLSAKLGTTSEESDISPDAFEAYLSRRAVQLDGTWCIWGHSESRGCGVLRAQFSWVAQVWRRRIRRPNSDSTLVVAAEDLSFGLDWHEGETGTWLRRWGILVE